MAGKSGEFVVEIQMEEGEPLGAVPNDKLVIMKVQKNTLADGKLQVGDQILKLNGQKISDQNHFFRALRYAPPVASLTILRDEGRKEEIVHTICLPTEREKNITRRDGFLYFIAKLSWKPGGQKLGLGIKHFQNRVLVSRVDPGSLSSIHLKVGDHIVDVNSLPVTDKDVAREILLKSLQQHSEVSMIIERPESLAAKHWTQGALAAQVLQPPSVRMNVDVCEIAQKERQRLKTKATKPPPPSILRLQNRKDQAVSFNKEEGFGHIIPSDNSGKVLRPVRK